MKIPSEYVGIPTIVPNPTPEDAPWDIRGIQRMPPTSLDSWYPFLPGTFTES